MKTSAKLYRALTATVPPIYFVILFVDLMIGGMFVTGWMMGTTESILYTSGVLIDRQLWGGLLVVAASLTIYGLIIRSSRAVRIGSLAATLLWFFAGASLILTSHIYVFIAVVTVQGAFHTFLYLLASVGGLFRRS